MPKPSRLPKAGLAVLRGRGWVALSNSGIIGRGLSADDAHDAAQLNRSKEHSQVTYVPDLPQVDLDLPPIFLRLRDLLPDPARVWLVGGAVRDALLRRPSRDLDFAVAGDGPQIARKVANQLGAAYYALDEARGAARVLAAEGGENFVLDFTSLRGDGLNADLAGRDLTINAIAYGFDGQLIDPMGGQTDLKARRLRLCSPAAVQDDPVRALRIVRLAVQLEFTIERAAREAVRQAVPLLTTVSAERVRDEFMAMLGGRRPAAALKALDALGILAAIVPETAALKGLTQSAPHIYPVWEHTLATVGYLDDLLGVLGRTHSIDAASEYALGYAAARVGRYRQEISDYLDVELSAGRRQRSLLFLAALLHDIAKPQTRSAEPGGRVRFLGHEMAGRDIAAERAIALRLANAETARVADWVAYHMRPVTLAQLGPDAITARAVYRFWRATGASGVGVSLITLADLLGTRGIDLGQAEWAARVDTVVRLLDAYYRTAERHVNPPVLLTGDDVLALGAAPGRLIGEVLEAVREAQAAGEVVTAVEALALAKRLVDESRPGAAN